MGKPCNEGKRWVLYFYSNPVASALHYTPLLNLTLQATNGMLVAFKNRKTALEGCDIKS